MPSRSEAQVNALRLIAEGGVKAYEFRAGGRWRVTAPGGRSIGTATYRALERDGLVDRNTSTALFEGQAVTLTEAGQAAIPRPRIEVVVFRDPDGDTTTTYFLDGLRVSSADLGIVEYDVDPGRSCPGAEREEWAESMEMEAQQASPAVAARIRRLVADYV